MRVVVLSASAMLWVAAQAVADESTPSSAPALVEGVVVTAQLRRENLQDVPVSAQVINGQDLAQHNLNSLEQLSQTVPDVHTGQNGRANEVYIRGIGSGVNPSFDQSAGTFVDDIYHGRSRMADTTFLDLDRVEILKGPQSTFFGNNAIAGAFNIVTRKPGDSFEADARALYGRYGQYAAEAEVGGPVVTDTLRARGAAIIEGQEGWLKNVFDGKHSPAENNGAARLTFALTPAENLDITLKNEGSRNRNSGAFPDQISNCPPPAPFTSGAFCKSALASGVPIGLTNNLTGSSPGQGITLSTVEEVLTANWHQWGHTFTSVSGYTNYHYRLNLDTDQQFGTLYQVNVPESYHQFSQELRLASPTGQTIEYLGGVYFQTDELSSHLAQNYTFLSPTISGNAKIAGLVPYLPIGTSAGFDQSEHSYAVFGSATWNITDSLKLSPGLRGTWVSKDFNGQLSYGTAANAYATNLISLPAALVPTATALGLGTPNNTSLSRDDSAWLPSVKLQYKFASSAMSYLSYSKGFKSGGFNGTDTSGLAANLPFSPEHVDSYEAGVKSKWLSERLLLNLDVFRMNYTDQQVAFQRPLPSGTFAGIVNNAASSRSQGAEFQGEWILTRSFRLKGQATYLNARYLDYANVTPTALQQLRGAKIQSLSGRPTEFAPHTSGSITATYSPLLPGGRHLTAEVTDTFSSAYYLTSVDDDLARQKTFSKVDARVTLATPGEHWNLDFIGRNLTNQNVLVFAAPMATSLGSFLEEKEMPRSWAVQARYHW